MGALPKGADIVIVGGGMSGLELAVELARAGAGDVAVLEAGPDSGGHVNAVNDPDLALRMWLEPGLDPHLWRPWTSGSAPHFETMAGLRRRVGGRSLYWHGVVLPLDSWALAEPWWPAGIINDLTESWDSGPSLYERVLSDIEVWRDGPALPESGLDVAGRRLRTVPQAIRQLPGGRFAAYTPRDRLASAGGAVRVISGAEVLEIRTDGGAVSGVQVALDGAREVHTVRSGIVVLAGGTVENSRLAIQVLRPAGLISEPRLGWLADKLAQGFIAPLDPAGLDPEILRLVDDEAFLCHRGDAGERSNLFVRFYRNAAGAAVVDAWAMGENLADEECVVECSPSPDDTPRWDSSVRVRYSDPDTESMGRQRDLLTKLLSEFDSTGSALDFPDPDHPDNTLETVLPTVATMLPGDPPAAWSGPLGSEYHESGTLAFGRMLTERHEVNGVPGLYVAGPAAYPRPGASNPSLTNLALARRLAGVLTR